MKRKTELRVCPREWARLKDSIQTATESDGLPAIYAARATDLVAAILYDSRGSTANGRKWLDGETVVRLPANYFAKVFKNNAAARRMKKLLVDSGVIGLIIFSLRISRSAFSRASLGIGIDLMRAASSSNSD